MNFFKVILAVVFIFFTVKYKAQLTHTTISSLGVSYAAEPQNLMNVGVNNTLELMAVPVATIVLQPEVNLTKLRFKILDKNTESVVYEITYMLNSEIITGSNGKKLFENNNGTLYLSSGIAIPIMPYKYELQTEDNQNNLSPIFSSIQ